jgi:alkaline phosphatase D
MERALALILAALGAIVGPLTGRAAALETIVFGSCNHQGRDQSYWEAVLGEKPDLFLFLGDNIYADTREREVMREKYRQMDLSPGFRALRAACPVLATWDDHDYGENDAGASFPAKAMAKEEFLEFFEVPAEDPRRFREGVYRAWRLGPPGRQVQVLLLDTRWFRGEVLRRAERPEGRGPYVPNEDPAQTMLGEKQWAWLERELAKPAELRLIASSVQVLPTEHGWEAWAVLPLERQRLLRLLEDSEASGVLLLSGDRHMAELSVLEVGVSYPLYEFTSSSLNLAFGGPPDGVREPNRLRVAGPVYAANYGVVRIDWEFPGGPRVALSSHAVDGAPLFTKTIPLRDLQR